MSDKAEYHEFIEAWASSRLRGLSQDDFDTQAGRLASELSEQALLGGYRTQLSRASKPYRSMLGYVAALHDVATRKPR